MKKLFIFAVAALAVGLILAPSAQATTYSFTYRNAACNAGGDDNVGSRTAGAQAVELCYMLRDNTATLVNGAMETNHGAGAANGAAIVGSGRTDFPWASGAPVLEDSGVMIQRTAAICGVVVDGAAIHSTLPTAPSQFVRASIFVLNGVNGAAGYESTGTAVADAGLATDAVTHMFYYGWQMSNNTNAVHTKIVLATDWSFAAVLHPAQASSLKVTSTPPAAEGAHTAFVRLQFPNTVMPNAWVAADFTGGGGTFSNSVDLPSSPKYGVRVYRNTTTAPAAAVAADFALATNTVINAGNATVRFDGVTPNGKYVGPALSGGFFFNDFSTDANGTPNVNYITVPVLTPDGLNPNGIPVHFAGSWQNPGQNSGAGGGLPTPVRVSSFESSFDPRTGKVTLNWRTSTEDDLSGFNIWRDTTVNGKPLGQRTFVAFVQAKTGLANVGADYSFVDTVDMSKYQRIARGKPIDVAYSIEEVSLSGNVTPAGTTNFTMSPKLAGTTR